MFDGNFSDLKIIPVNLTVRDLVNTHSEMWEYDYKWNDSDNYRDVNKVLKQKGYKLVQPEDAGEYNDIKAYLNCKIISIK